MVIIAVAIVRVQNLFAAIILTGFYSLLSAGMFVILAAVDVAFTEAAVGAGMCIPSDGQAAKARVGEVLPDWWHSAAPPAPSRAGPGRN